MPENSGERFKTARAPASEEKSAPIVQPEDLSAGFPVVGIGASAGGLDALRAALAGVAGRHRHGLRHHPAPQPNQQSMLA
jgi:chemotaxis response regulator CheB